MTIRRTDLVAWGFLYLLAAGLLSCGRDVPVYAQKVAVGDSIITLSAGCVALATAAQIAAPAQGREARRRELDEIDRILTERNQAEMAGRTPAFEQVLREAAALQEVQKAKTRFKAFWRVGRIFGYHPSGGMP